jgi:hypothetical protein
VWLTHRLPSLLISQQPFQHVEDLSSRLDRAAIGTHASERKRGRTFPRDPGPYLKACQVLGDPLFQADVIDGHADGAAVDALHFQVIHAGRAVHVHGELFEVVPIEPSIPVVGIDQEFAHIDVQRVVAISSRTKIMSPPAAGE